MLVDVVLHIFGFKMSQKTALVFKSTLIGNQNTCYNHGRSESPRTLLHNIVRYKCVLIQIVPQLVLFTTFSLALYVYIPK